jgi:hypothetical protein
LKITQQHQNWLVVAPAITTTEIGDHLALEPMITFAWIR